MTPTVPPSLHYYEIARISKGALQSNNGTLASLQGAQELKQPPFKSNGVNGGWGFNCPMFSGDGSIKVQRDQYVAIREENWGAANIDSYQDRASCEDVKSNHNRTEACALYFRLARAEDAVSLPPFG